METVNGWVPWDLRSEIRRKTDRTITLIVNCAAIKLIQIDFIDMSAIQVIELVHSREIEKK